MKKFILLFGCFLLMFTGQSLVAQKAASVFQAVYVYNFTKYITFPPARQSGDFIIGVLGYSPIVAPLEKTASIKKAGNQSIKIVVYDSPSSIADCHLLYIPERSSRKLSEVANLLRGKPTVIVTEGSGLSRGKSGSGISITQEGEKKFEINRSAIEASNMKVSSELLRLAIIVD